MMQKTTMNGKKAKCDRLMDRQTAGYGVACTRPKPAKNEPLLQRLLSLSTHGLRKMEQTELSLEKVPIDSLFAYSVLEIRQ